MIEKDVKQVDTREPSAVLRALLEDKTPAGESLDTLVRFAVHRRATDIYCSPRRDDYQLRMRCDGVVAPLGIVPRAWGERLINHTKVDARLSGDERRRPQDGKILVEDPDHTIDVRVSTLPTVFGEELALRILDRRVRLIELDKLGLHQRAMEVLRELMGYTHGLILVSGPAGSGKSTTLYSILNELSDGTRKIHTVEDPVECYLPGLDQTQVNVKLKLDFSDVLPAVLRHDPDVIMIGEIRDVETARVALRAAATGQLVFATVHASTAAGAVHSMLGLEANPHVLAGALRGVIAQDLLRRLCPQCAEPLETATDTLVLDEIRPLLPTGATPSPRQAKGCEACMGTGHQGLVAIFEVLRCSGEIEQAVEQEQRPDKIEAMSVEDGMVPLRLSAKLAVAKGFTTLRDAMRLIEA